MRMIAMVVLLAIVSLLQVVAMVAMAANRGHCRCQLRSSMALLMFSMANYMDAIVTFQWMHG